jgi:hypothetical protein
VCSLHSYPQVDLSSHKDQGSSSNMSAEEGEGRSELGSPDGVHNLASIVPTFCNAVRALSAYQLQQQQQQQQQGAFRLKGQAVGQLPQLPNEQQGLTAACSRCACLCVRVCLQLRKCML